MTPVQLGQLHDMGLLCTTEEGTQHNPKIPVDLQLFNELERIGNAMSFSLACLCRTTHGMGGEGGKCAELCVAHRHRRKLCIEDCPDFYAWDAQHVGGLRHRLCRACERHRVKTRERVGGRPRQPATNDVRSHNAMHCKKIGVLYLNRYLS